MGRNDDRAVVRAGSAGPALRAEPRGGAPIGTAQTRSERGVVVSSGRAHRRRRRRRAVARWHPQVSEEFALVGLAGSRAYALYAAVEESVVTDVLGFTQLGGGEYRLEGERRPLPLGLRPAGRRPGSGRWHRPPRRLGDPRRRTAGVAQADRRGPAAM